MLEVVILGISAPDYFLRFETAIASLLKSFVLLHLRLLHVHQQTWSRCSWQAVGCSVQPAVQQARAEPSNSIECFVLLPRGAWCAGL